MMLLRCLTFSSGTCEDGWHGQGGTLSVSGKEAACSEGKRQVCEIWR